MLLHISSQDKNRNLTFIADIDHFCYLWSTFLLIHCKVNIATLDLDVIILLELRRLKVLPYLLPQAIYAVKNLKISDICIWI